MKRILSIIITLAMLLSSVSAFATAYPADKANAIIVNSDFENGDLGGLVMSNGKITDVSGMYGKTADDVSGCITENSGAIYSYMAYDHGEPIYKDNGAELEGYVAVEFNFKPNDGFGYAQVSVSQRQHCISETIRATTAGYNANGWNHVKVVYDPTGHGDFSQVGDDGKYVVENGAVLGTTTTYLNGVQVGEAKTTTKSEGWFDYGASSLLIQFISSDAKPDASKGIEDIVRTLAYIDDIKIYKTTENAAPVAATLADSDAYTVSGTNLLINEATTVADIKAANPALARVAAYKDYGLTYAVADDAALSAGDYVVAVSADGVYVTYKVADPKEADYILNITDGVVAGSGVSIARLATTPVDGMGGKPAYDTVSKWQYNATSGDANGYVQLAGYTNDGTNPYFVIEFNYYPETADTLFIATNGNAPVVGGISVSGGTMKANQWNKVLAYMDYSGEAPVGYLFINGANLETCKKDYTGAGNVFGVNKPDLRIGFHSTTEQSYTAYVDDLKIYETDTAPTVAQTAAPKLVSNDKAEISGSTIKTTLGTTVADLEADNDAAIYAFTSDGQATQALVGGATVAVIGSNAAIGYYTVGVTEETTELLNIASYADYTAANIASPRANTEEALGFGGKDAADSAIKIAQEGKPENDKIAYYDWYLQHSWGTATKPTDTESSTWDKADYTGYLVYEADIYNESLTNMQFVTDQGSVISKSFEVGKGKWSKVHLVVNETGDANDGKAIVYVDGEVAADWTKHCLGEPHSTTNVLKNSIRFIARGLKIEENADYSDVTDFGTAYLDNIKMYETTVMPVVKEEEVVTGIIADSIPETIIRGTVETVDGFAGKTADNTVYKITRTEESPNESDAFYQITYKSQLEEAKYIVLESDVYSESNYGGAYYATKGHAYIGKGGRNDAGEAGADKWNKYITVVDVEGGYIADTYINGVLISEDDETPFMSGEGYNVIRVVFPMEIGASVYCDNYKIYETNVYPEIAVSPVAENGIYTNGVLTDNYIYVKKGTTVDDAATILGKTAIIYTDNTFATEELGSAEAYNGLVAAVIDAENDLYYSRKIMVIDEVPAPGESEFVILGEGNSTMEPVTVVANMAAGDVFVMKQDIVQNVTEVNDAGEATTTVEESVGTRKLIIAEENGIEISTIVPQAENGKLRAFMIDNLTSIRPLGGQTVIECPFPVVEVEAK